MPHVASEEGRRGVSEFAGNNAHPVAERSMSLMLRRATISVAPTHATRQTRLRTMSLPLCGKPSQWSIVSKAGLKTVIHTSKITVRQARRRAIYGRF